MTSTVPYLLLAACALGSGLLLWFYWAVVFPAVRLSILFRAEKQWLAFLISSREGGLPESGKLFSQVSRVLLDARLAAAGEHSLDSVKIAGEEEVRAYRVWLENLLAEISGPDASDVRETLHASMRNLMALYLAQRPMVAGTFLCMIAASYFINRYKATLAAKELDAAAYSLAAAH